MEELQAEGRGKDAQINQLRNEVVAKEALRRQSAVSSLPVRGVTVMKG